MTPKPLHIAMHPNDNVAIVANDGGLPAGTALPSGLVLRDKVPQGHKVALVDLAAGGRCCATAFPLAMPSATFRRAAGCTSGCCPMPEARELDALPMATTARPGLAPAGGLHL
jgi:galactarate dehydratase